MIIMMMMSILICMIIIIMIILLVIINNIIVTQVQQMKMFNAQFEKEMSAEGRKNRKMMEKVSF